MLCTSVCPPKLELRRADLSPPPTQHRNVISLLGIYIAVDGTLGIVTEVSHSAFLSFRGALPLSFLLRQFLPRGSVFHLLHTNGSPSPLALPLALRLLRDCAEGMSYLHAMSPPIIHRDLKVRSRADASDEATAWKGVGFPDSMTGILTVYAVCRRAKICWWQQISLSRSQTLALQGSVRIQMQ